MWKIKSCFIVLIILIASQQGRTQNFYEADDYEQKSFKPKQNDTSYSRLGLRIYPFLINQRWERNSQQELAPIRLSSGSVGFMWSQWGAQLEFANFSVEEGNSSLSLKRDHQEALAWLRYDYFRSRNLELYMSGGLGLYQENISTQVQGNYSNDETGWLNMTALGLGAEIPIKFVVIGGEIRLVNGEDFDPKTQFAYMLKLGLNL